MRSFPRRKQNKSVSQFTVGNRDTGNEKATAKESDRQGSNSQFFDSSEQLSSFS